MPKIRPDFKFIIKLQRCPSTDEKNAEEKRLRLERRRELARIRKQRYKDWQERAKKHNLSSKA